MQQIGCWGPTSKEKMIEAGKKIIRTGDSTAPIDLRADELPWGLFEREKDDWSGCVYFYLDTPDSGLPALCSLEQRLAGLSDDPGASKTADI